MTFKEILPLSTSDIALSIRDPIAGNVVGFPFQPFKCRACAAAHNTTISLKAVCKDVLLNPTDSCLEPAVVALNGFPQFMKTFLKN